jgi:polysaccharide export outer membrane protein
MKYCLSKLLILTVTVTVTSCISNKKIAYLQYKNEYKEPESIVKDSLIRKYKTGEFSYKLQPNDLIDVKISTMTPSAFNPFIDADRTLVPGQVFSQQTNQTGNQVQSQGYSLDPAGFIELPIVGSVMIAGLSVKEAEDTLATRVNKYLTDPVVRLKLLNFKFSVIGEVDKEATLVSGDNYMTLLQALSMAGGASEFGDLSRVKIIRRYDKETYVFYVNLLNEEFLSSPFYFVQPNDVIAVFPLKQRSYLKYLSPNLSVLTASASLLVALATLLTLR